MKVYLLTLQGAGDTEATVVDEETFAWVTSEDPGRPDNQSEEFLSSWPDQLVPESALNRMDERPILTSGSWQNDRALCAPAAEGYKEVFWTVKEATDAIKERGDEIAGSWEGHIY